MKRMQTIQPANHPCVARNGGAVWCFNPLFDYKLVSLACGFGYVKTSGQGDGRSCGSGHFSACKVVDVGRFAGG